MYFPESVFLVVGLAKSGSSAAREILKRGGKCYVYDESTERRVLDVKQQLTMLGAVDACDNVDKAICDCDVVVLSPGIPIDHKIPVAARKMKKRIMGELELGSMLVKSPIIAVTGTNGKTTTCSLISCILSKSGRKNLLAGNIGSPLCDYANELDERCLAVVEVSSFQLETVHSFCPHIAVILNITPDHLSRHYNMENYIYLKKRILTNMRESEFCVLNFDDECVRSFSVDTRCNVVYFSRNEKVDGAYIENDNIYFRGEFVMAKADIPISGEHNVENVLAAICACRLIGCSVSEISGGVMSFAGVKHRIEFVKEIEGVRFYNDSKSTNVDSTLKAVNAMTEPTIIILGGKDKRLEYVGLFEKLKNSKVKFAVLMGENRYKLLEAAKQANFENVALTGDFESAIHIAAMESRRGDAVLLSPGTSSFDMFSGFEERGDAFIKIVNGLDE